LSFCRRRGLSDHQKKFLQGAGVSNAEKFGSQSRARSQTSDVVASCLVNWASLPLDAIRRPRNTPIWKLEAALKCRSCKKGRYAPPVRMIKLTQEREITPYIWVHPDEER
jgi:hypothetical protein